MTRIIAGTAGGRRLRTPRGSSTRPTSDRVREGAFSALVAAMGSLAGIGFLDLYAGSGAVGLEARSRGAAAVTLVEEDRRAAALIRSNAERVGLLPVTVLEAKVERVLAGHRTDGFDVVFADPPYSLPAESLRDVVARLASSGWSADAALVVLERSSRDPAWDWPPGFTAVRSKRYGETMLWYGRAPGHRTLGGFPNG
ncbi:MAG TPA: 16S rRNA (guanine(966)-N(2))-methyltransferase RsmD [Nocardioidaceae bacterium]|nr:16S rRNA (guanine(966)-N(2))-methyltransferase RsmD [Nocardioidaceae bacterium]